MRIRSLARKVWLLGIVGVLLSVAAWSAAAQNVAPAARLPRFLVVLSPQAKPVEVNANGAAVLRRIVSLNIDHPTVGRVLAAIEAQTGIQIGYSPDIVPIDRPVALGADTITVGGALLAVLLDSGLDVLLSPGDKLAIIKRDGAVPARAPVRTGRIAGIVTDTTTGKPLVGAEVSLKGTAFGAQTDARGVYFLANVPAGPQAVIVRLLGYRPGERAVVVADSQDARVDFALHMTMTRLQEIVTTATGPRRRMDLASDVTVLDVDSLVATQPVSTVTDLLATRVPGLVVQHTSGAPGDPARLRLRGVSSISRGNDPIVIVDGARIYYDQSGNQDVLGGQLLRRGDNLAAGGAYTAPSPLDQLDVNSIETIEVLKGPSAATLYGADAANGVIVITTKKGRPGPAHWNVSASQGLSYIPGRYSDMYVRLGHDYNGNLRLCPLTSPCAAGVDSLVRFQALNDPSLTILGQGRSTSLTLGVDGGTSGLSYSLTGSYDDETGVLKLPGVEATRFEAAHGYAPASWMQRPQTLNHWNATGTVTAKLGPKADASFSAMLTRETQQQSSLETQLAQLAATYVDRATGTYYSTQFGSFFPKDVLVPDFYTRVTDGTTNFTNTASLNWRPRSWLTATADGGLNVIAREDEKLLPRDMLDTLGALTAARGSSVQGTVNVRGLATAPLPLGFKFQFALGANYTKTTIGDQFTSVDGLAKGTTGLNGASEVLQVAEDVNDQTSLGWYVEPAISQKRFFIDAGFRFDGGSTYGSHAKLPTFPKLGGTWLISDEPWFPFKTFINTLRLRAAYGHAGVQPGITDRLRLYKGSNGFVDGGPTTVLTVVNSSLGNAELKPERSTEIEGGFDTDLWDDRLSLGFSGYRKIRKDALLSVPIAPSVYGAGGSRLENIGVVRNTGLEASVMTQLVRTDLLTWSSTLSVSRDRNMVVSLAPGVKQIYIGGDQYVKAGYPIFGAWERPITGYADVNGDGIIESGEVQVGDSAVFLGETLPNYQATVHSTFSLLRGAITLDAGLTYQGGLTQNDQAIAQNPLSVRGAMDPATPLGEQAAIAALRYTSYGVVQTVSTLRLNSLSVAYNAAPSIARRFGASALSVALQGTNLGLRSNYRGKDPDVNGLATGNLTADAGVLPQPRTWNLRLTARF